MTDVKVGAEHGDKESGVGNGQDFAPDRAAQALLNLRCAVDHCHDGSSLRTQNGKIEFVNAAFEAMTGYSAHEAMEGGLALIIKRDPTGDRKPISASSGVGLEEIMQKGFYRGAISIARKDARLIRMDLAVTVVRDYRTREASVVCTARDITDEGGIACRTPRCAENGYDRHGCERSSTRLQQSADGD